MAILRLIPILCIEASLVLFLQIDFMSVIIYELRVVFLNEAGPCLLLLHLLAGDSLALPLMTICVFRFVSSRMHLYDLFDCVLPVLVLQLDELFLLLGWCGHGGTGMQAGVVRRVSDDRSTSTGLR